MIPPEQAGVAALLRAVTGAEPVETHISAVFVGREDAFKLKKAVRLPFIDQSTPARREALARRELELNRPHAPAIYRDVLPVTRDAAARRALGGEGRGGGLGAAPRAGARPVTSWMRWRRAARSTRRCSTRSPTRSRRCWQRRRWPRAWTRCARMARGSRGATWPAAATPGSTRRGSRRWRRRCARGLGALAPSWRRARGAASSGAAMATSTSAISACGRAGPCPSTRWNSTRRWRG
jgi:hypothetical protein